jgi:hypothetical protein
VEPPVDVARRDASYDGGAWRWSAAGNPVDATVEGAGGFMRAMFESRRTPVGESVGQRSVDFWRFADAELGMNIGPLTAAVDVTGGSVASCAR